VDEAVGFQAEQVPEHARPRGSRLADEVAPVPASHRPGSFYEPSAIHPPNPKATPVGTVLTAQNAFVGPASAGVGTTLYSGDSISTDWAGSVQISAKAARFFLTEVSAAVLSNTDGVLSARLVKGTAKFSTANARAFTLFASKAAIRPNTDAPTIAQVTYVNEKELLVLAQRGALAVTVDGETKIIPEGSGYQVLLEPAANMAAGQGGPPLKAGRSTFVLVAIGVVAVITGLAVSEALESPSRP